MDNICKKAVVMALTEFRSAHGVCNERKQDIVNLIADTLLYADESGDDIDEIVIQAVECFHKRRGQP